MLAEVPYRRQTRFVGISSRCANYVLCTWLLVVATKLERKSRVKTLTESEMSIMNVIRSFKYQPLRSASDLRKLRGQLRAASADLGADSRSQFEFIGACTAVARNLLHRPGRCEVRLSVLSSNSHEGLCVTFSEVLPELAMSASRSLVQSLMTGLSQHGMADIDRLVNQIDVDRRGNGRSLASLVKWIH